MWVVPLGLYLLSFVLVFRARPAVPERASPSCLQAWAGAVVLMNLGLGGISLAMTLISAHLVLLQSIRSVSATGAALPPATRRRATSRPSTSACRSAACSAASSTGLVAPFPVLGRVSNILDMLVSSRPSPAGRARSRALRALRARRCATHRPALLALMLAAALGAIVAMTHGRSRAPAGASIPCARAFLARRSCSAGAIRAALLLMGATGARAALTVLRRGHSCNRETYRSFFGVSPR